MVCGLVVGKRERRSSHRGGGKWKEKKKIIVNHMCLIAPYIPLDLTLIIRGVSHS